MLTCPWVIPIRTTLKHPIQQEKKLTNKIRLCPNIVSPDDNYGQTTAMWEAYYRYYYKDGNYAALDGSRQSNTSTIVHARGNNVW